MVLKFINRSFEAAFSWLYDRFNGYLHVVCTQEKAEVTLRDADTGDE